MRVSRGVHPIAASLALMSAVTVVLWQVKINTAGSHHLAYFYLLPIVLIAVLYNGRTAILCVAIALVGADYFLEDPIYSLVDDDLREFGDLVWFALLAVTAIKFVRGLVRPHTKILEARSRYGRK
jgi:K+-sensing histidine kinase KdpD